jgi:precorrin-2 dehydrogenase / sirohydrochlorin ferrochelatase
VNFRYPIYLDLAGKRCVVTGEGYEVPAKVAGLVEVGAEVTYIHPAAAPEILELINAGQVKWEARGFEASDLDGCFLLITSRPDNAEIFRLAEERGVLCNSVDDPQNCRFSHGSIHRQGDLTIGISTNGTAPAVAVRIKEMLQREVGPEYKQLLELLVEIRPAINSQLKSFAVRKDLWYRIVDSDALALFRSGDAEGAARVVHRLVDEAVSNTLGL